MREWHSQIIASPIQSLHLGCFCVYQCVCPEKNVCAIWIVVDALFKERCRWAPNQVLLENSELFHYGSVMISKYFKYGVYCTCICMAKQCSRHSTFWWTFESFPAEHVAAFETSNIHTLLQQAWYKFDVLTFKCDSFTQHHKSFLRCVALVHLFLLEQFFVDLAVLDYIGCWYVLFLSKPTLNLFIAAKQHCQSPWIWRFDHSNRCPLPAIDLVIESQTLWSFGDLNGE